MDSSDLGSDLADSAEVKMTNFRMEFDAGVEYITINTKISGFFVSNVYAMSCPPDGDYGLKYPVVSVDFFCNKDLPGFPSGTSLTEKIRAYRPSSKNDADMERYLMDEWKTRLKIYNESIWYFEFSEIIESPDYLQFTMRIEFDDGSILESSTKNVKLV